MAQSVLEQDILELGNLTRGIQRAAQAHDWLKNEVKGISIENTDHQERPLAFIKTISSKTNEGKPKTNFRPF